ncbi:MAG: DNA methyltransferase, partial [Coriobacteriia bacterium]|nr:DNA methyltransferase [Coriobacteriia bacterium]
KKLLEQRKTTEHDECTGGAFTTVTRVPVAVNYRTHQGDFDKPVDDDDRDILSRIRDVPWPTDFPSDRMMHTSGDTQRWGDKWRAGTAAFQNVHHLYLKRSALVLWALWTKASQVSDSRCRAQLLFTFDQTLWTASILNRYRPASSFGNGPLKGVFYVPGQIAEANVLSLANGALQRVLRGFREDKRIGDAQTFVTTGDCSTIGLPDSSVDYVFTDPPFGANFAYAELNFITEAFYRVFTNVVPEAIVSPARSKSVHEYQDLMTACFAEYYRVLKPGRWMTVVFSNSSNAIWRSIQEALATAGFVVGDVRTLDKKHGSFNQVIGVTVDQDLIVTVYRPSSGLERELSIETAAGGAAWTFVNEHLSHVPVVSAPDGSIEVVAERTSQMLHDRMVGFFVQRGLAVPLSAAEFMAGLAQRYPERDGMYFMSQQVAAYDKRRAQSDSVRQLSLIVTDESSAIQWIRQQLSGRPQSFPELAPVFMREAQQSWAKHEEQVELRALLEENFLLYDGRGPVPSQIKSYLSTNWREYRNLESDDPTLQAKARDRWYVPDPGKESDLQKLRERQLLKEFEHYRTSSARKLKLFRTEAVRTGFKRAYDERDWQMIVEITERLPDSVVQEDEKLLMYYDVARMRVG